MPRRRAAKDEDEDLSEGGEINYDNSDVDGDDDDIEIPELDVDGSTPTDAEVAAHTAKVHRPPDVIYAEFRARAERNIAELDRIRSLALNTFASTKAAGVRVQALRAATSAAWTKHRIADQTIVRGQELGILPTAVRQNRTNVQVSGGVLLGAMSTADLMTRQRELVKEGKRLRDEYGAGQFASFADPEDIYEGEIEGGEGGVSASAEPVRIRRTKV